MAVEKRDMALEAEQAVLGSLLIEPEIAREMMSRVAAEDFLLEQNRAIYQTARALFRAGEPVDAFSIRNRMGGEVSAYLVGLMEITPTSANWQEYAGYMKQQASLRRVRDLADRLRDASTLEDCRSAVADLGQLLADGRQLDTWSTREMLEDFLESQGAEAPVEYVKTGLSMLDQGIYTELGDVMVVGGEPSAGKTAFALTLAYHMAKRYKVGFFSLETDKKKVRDRMMAHAAQVDFGAIKSRDLTEEDWRAVIAKRQDFTGRDLTVVRSSGMTATEIQAATLAYGFQVIFIDYVQLITPEIDRRSSRNEQIADISRSLHVFAQKHGILVVELAQISRMDKTSGWREPDMHDLRESGQLEQDADIIYMLFRPNPKDTELDTDQHRILKVAKNKEGRRGKWPLYFDGSRQTFSPMVEVGDGGKAVMRQMYDAGMAAKKRNRQEAIRNQVRMVELPPEGDDPFVEGGERV